MMLRFTILVSLLAFVGLPAVALAAGHEASPDALEKRLASSGRPEADVARDAGRKPGEVLAFLGVESGMTALDLIAAGGYYTEVLSVAVGSTGRVYAHNTDFVLKMRDGANEKAISKRLAEGRLANVERVDAEVSAMGIAPNSVDVALTALNFHDIVNGRGPQATRVLLASVKRVLKPGGVFGVLDHDGDPEQDNKKLHRMPKQQAVQWIESAGFELVAEADMLRNPKDDHSQGVFSEGLRGQTDRFVLKFRKPE